MITRTWLRLLVLGLFSTLSFYLQAQNVGVGTSSPQDRLHATGFFRSDSLQSMSDTVLTAASPQGRIIALPPGDSGQVLRSQGSGKAPVWQTPSGGGGRTYMRRLNSAVSVTTSTSSSGSATLFNETIVPEQDTIIVQVNVSAWVTSSSVPATPGQPFLVRVFKDAALIANIGASPQSNSAVSGATQGRLTVSYSLPLPVTPGSPVNIRITLQSLFTNSGSMTLGIDPSTPSNSASLIIYDLPQF